MDTILIGFLDVLDWKGEKKNAFSWNWKVPVVKGFFKQPFKAEMIGVLETHQYSSWISNKNLKIFYEKHSLMKELVLLFLIPSNSFRNPVLMSWKGLFLRHCLSQASNHLYQHRLITCETLPFCFVLQFTTYPQESSITGNGFLSSFQHKCGFKHEKHLQSVSILMIHCFS